MKIDEIDMLYEMSWFDPDDTGLPNGINIWLRADPTDHGHSRYRLKVDKDNTPAGIFLVSSTPRMIKPLRHKLSPKEINAIEDFIKDNLSVLINHIDSKISSARCGMDIQKNRSMLGVDGKMKMYRE